MPAARRRRIQVIVNPTANSGRAWQTLRRTGVLEARPRDVELEWVESSSSDDLQAKVRKAQEAGLDAIGLAGGDGTVTLALQALQPGNRIPLGLIPVGSGNDFAKDCGVPGDLSACLETLLHGAPRAVDLVRCLPSERRYCCVAAVGLDELALRLIYGSWLPRSRGLNILATLRALASYQPRAVRLSWLGGSFEGEVMFAAVTNTTSYGGGFLITPNAKVDDGLMDICIVRRTGRVRLISQFPRILRGTHGEMPEVIFARSPWVRIEADGPSLPVPLDGELGMASSPVELRCEARAVNVLVPPAVASGATQEVRLAS